MRTPAPGGCPARRSCSFPDRTRPGRPPFAPPPAGGWWNRQNNPGIDLIGADREPVAGRVHFLGPVKWPEDRPFDRHDYDALVRDMLAAPGAGTTSSAFGLRPARTVMR